ncbi:MAG: RHS repeat-associated core domain-containing protein, partial [Gammaproteobacteria bacterium]|nr:RHS repeat-associated core domain-containing protein [Gammaproteobacteria bacterium]
GAVKKTSPISQTYIYDKAGRLREQTGITSYSLTDGGTPAPPAVPPVLNDFAAGVNAELISWSVLHYDAAGDIEREQSLAPAAPPELPKPPEANMTYDSGTGSRLATYDNKRAIFDADGNMTHGPLRAPGADTADMPTEFVFDSRNRLSGIGMPPKNTKHLYNTENHRIGMRVNGKNTWYAVNPAAVLSQVLVRIRPNESGDGEIKTYYIYGPNGLIGEETDGEYRAYHYDTRGSTTALTDTDGKVTDRFQYSPYGVLLKHLQYQYNPDGTVIATDRTASPPAGRTPFLFNGKYGVMTDPSGLYYMRARYYNPEIRRFMNQDILMGSVTDGQSLNRFAFVSGNPVSYVDPFGLFEVQDERNLLDDDMEDELALQTILACIDVKHNMTNPARDCISRLCEVAILLCKNCSHPTYDFAYRLIHGDVPKEQTFVGSLKNPKKIIGICVDTTKKDAQFDFMGTSAVHGMGHACGMPMDHSQTGPGQTYGGIPAPGGMLPRKGEPGYTATCCNKKPPPNRQPQLPSPPYMPVGPFE